MKPFPVAVVGAGSQPAEDEHLQYLASPGAMATFHVPAPRPPVSAAALAEARRLLLALHEQMQSQPFDAEAAPVLDLMGVAPETVGEINELLGQGEVSCRLGSGALRIQETAFASIWRVQEQGEDGRLRSDRVETGAIPRVVREALERREERAPAAPLPGPGVMNAPALLHEIREASAASQPGAAARVVNLTLLPVTPEDLDYLAGALGQGPVTMLSRGYGNCRVSATALPRVWWVRYYNSMDQLILDTIETVDIPAVALAAREDYEDSTERLGEWIETLEA